MKYRFKYMGSVIYNEGSKQEILSRIAQTIRIYHEFVDRIDNSVSMVTILHHEALPSDAKESLEGQNYLSYSKTHVGFIFLHTFGC